MTHPVYQRATIKNAEAFDGIGRSGQSSFTGIYRLSIYCSATI